MKTVTEFARKVVEIADQPIVMTDGCRLSARLWMPQDAAERPVPVILEHLPYRKRDGTVARDQFTHPYFAGHGYACLRVDMRGNGDSEGLMEDEYSEQELADACEVIAWAAAQPWSNGRVGMMGISWGGFNALQVAAKRPQALKAIITLCSTDDRYADDIHYKGGLLLTENQGWGATMLSYSSRPPDPMIVGEARWRGMWLERLENEPFLVETWLGHQARDAYWKRGSVCEDYAAIEAATLAVGGWGDGYKNAVGRLVSNLSAPAKGIIGPWIHKYPHFAVPQPAIGFLQEALRWWDRWLKDVDTGVEGDPAMRIYLMDSVPPRDWYGERPGRWIAEPDWPSAGINARSFAFGGDLEGPALPATVSSPMDCGLAGGEYCAIWLGPDMPGDQSADDAVSLCFERRLETDLDIVGGPVVRMKLSADRPQAMLAVRLCDVQPDGKSTRITYGVLNLAHRNGHGEPRPIVPGETMDIALRLDDIAYRIPAGHRLRVAISSNYWPLVWPSPERATLRVAEGALELPVRKAAAGDEWQPPEPEAAPAWQGETLREAAHQRKIERAADGSVSVVIDDDFGTTRDLDHGLVKGEIARERWTIHPDDPLSARGETHWTQTLARGEWAVRTETFTSMSSTRERFVIKARVEAYEGKTLVFQKDFSRTVDRELL